MSTPPSKFSLRSFARSLQESLQWGRYSRNCPLVRAALGNMTPMQLEYTVNISPRYHYVYVDNPKTGCSSLKSALVDLELRGADSNLDCYDWMVYHNPGVSPLVRLTALGVPDPLSHLARSGFQFVTFVRNPYDRLISCYRDRILRNRTQKGMILKILGHPEDRLETPVSFEEFIRAVVSQTDYEMDPHWRVQTSQALYELFEFSFVGRFERYDDDYMALFRRLGLRDTEIPKPRHLNPTGKDEGKGREVYFTDELRELVFNRYRKDFDNFGYGYEFNK
jgi:hypothetical protein